MAGLSGTGGSRKIPTFNRPGVAVSSGTPKRSWKQVPVTGIKAGDTIADYGLVHEIVLDRLAVAMMVGDRQEWTFFTRDTTVLAFTEDAQ
jgi:hypothetical protein